MLSESLHKSELHVWHEQSVTPFLLQKVSSIDAHKSVRGTQPRSENGDPFSFAFISYNVNKFSNN